MFVAIFLALLASTPTEHGKGVTELEYHNALLEKAGLPPTTQEEFDRTRAWFKKWESEYEGHRLKGAGFEPPEKIQKDGLTVVRLTISEPRLFLRIPGVTLRPQDDGSAQVILSSDGRARAGKTAISSTAWNQLKEREDSVFQPDPPPPPPPYATWNRGDPLPEPRGVCHAWGTVVERITPATHEKVSAHGCNDDALTQARLRYAQEVAALAIAAFPECASSAPDSEPFWRLGTCFGKFEPSTTDNP